MGVALTPARTLPQVVWAETGTIDESAPVLIQATT